MGKAELSEDGDSGVQAADCRAQLQRILDSADFDATDRAHRFLRHVVEETLADRGDRIKAYSIAVEVFGRDASFDPQSDPIVRIEAGHLRRALERYYLTAGVSDPVLVTIPKGGYVPVFSRRSQQKIPPAEPLAPAPDAPPDAVPARTGGRLFMASAALAAVVLLAAGLSAWWWISSAANPGAPERPRLLVLPFDDLTGSGTSTAVARGLSQEIVGQLSKFKDIVVIESADAGPPGAAPSPRFALAGSVNLSPASFRLRVRLLNRSDGSVLWANSYDGAMSVGGLLEAQSGIARDVATTLAQTYGVIFKADASLSKDNPPDDWAAYACTLAFYAYRQEVDLNDLPAVRECLEKAVARFPSYATAWGLLSQAYIDEVRFNYSIDADTTSKRIDLAAAAAKRAIELDPYNVRGLQAQMFALYFTKDIDASLEAGKRALSINPNDTELIGEYGYRLALSGNWAEGCPLVAEARERNPGPGAYYETAMALCSYFSSDYSQAAALIKRGSGLHNPNYHAIAAAIYAESGRKADAERERVWLETNVPALVKNARQEIYKRFAYAKDAERFLASLKKAGLDIQN